MARRTRKRKKRGWLKGVFLFVFTLCIIWSSAFLVWLFWADIEGFFRSLPTVNGPQETPERTQEKILEEDRKKLEEILEQRR